MQMQGQRTLSVSQQAAWDALHGMWPAEIVRQLRVLIEVSRAASSDVVIARPSRGWRRTMRRARWQTLGDEADSERRRGQSLETFDFDRNLN